MPSKIRCSAEETVVCLACCQPTFVRIHFSMASSYRYHFTQRQSPRGLDPYSRIPCSPVQSTLIATHHIWFSLMEILMSSVERHSNGRQRSYCSGFVQRKGFSRASLARWLNCVSRPVCRQGSGVKRFYTLVWPPTLKPI